MPRKGSSLWFAVGRLAARWQSRAALAGLLVVPGAVPCRVAPPIHRATVTADVVWQIPDSLLGDGQAVSALPAYVPDAFIAVEDHRFYHHHGVDYLGVLAAIRDRMLGRHTRGASTITQQLVGLLHPALVNRSEHSLFRKLYEQHAALEMERHYTKAQILQAYLSVVPLGHGVFGVPAGARYYFEEDVPDLTLAQAATLAAMPKAPAHYDPNRFPDRTLARRNLVLGLMTHQGFIKSDEEQAALAEPMAAVGRDVEVAASEGDAPAAASVAPPPCRATTSWVPVKRALNWLRHRILLVRYAVNRQLHLRQYAKVLD